MPSILNDADRASILARLRNLTPSQQPLWGKLTAPRMVCHLCDSLRVALGDVPSRPRGNVLHRTLIKWLILYLPIPTPKGKIETVPEMLATEPTEWQTDIATFADLLDRLADATTVAPHPAFGKMSHRQWGLLAYRHIDHHLRQFQV